MKYFTEENLTPEQFNDLQVVDASWINRENNSEWTFIHKSDIKVHKGIDNFMWEHIKDLIPVRKEV